MAIDLRQEIVIARHEVAASLDMLKAASMAHKRALTALQRAAKCSLKDGIDAQPVSDIPITEHRKQHRAGRPAKIDTDPELQAFIRARIDRLTYQELAQDVAAYFPPNRSVSRSSIQRWWQRQTKAKP